MLSDSIGALGERIFKPVGLLTAVLDVEDVKANVKIHVVSEGF